MEKQDLAKVMYGEQVMYIAVATYRFKFCGRSEEYMWPGWNV